jgi:hypothetical protein
MAMIQPDTLVAWKSQVMDDEDFIAVQFSWVPHGGHSLAGQVHGNWLGLPREAVEQLIPVLQQHLETLARRSTPPAPPLLQ